MNKGLFLKKKNFSYCTKKADEYQRWRKYNEVKLSPALFLSLLLQIKHKEIKFPFSSLSIRNNPEAKENILRTSHIVTSLEKIK